MYKRQYQAEGSGGRLLLEGAKYLRLYHEQIPVRAEIVEVGQLSAHAGRSELLRWLSGIQVKPRQTFLVHGEPTALDSFRTAITAQYHWSVTIPDYQQTFDL